MGYKKRLIAIMILCMSLACSKNEYKVNTENNDIFDDSIDYDIGKVYIGNQSYLDSLDNTSNTDILVLDQRENNDPNIKIIDSYKINNLEEMDYILNEIIKYEKNNPSEWSRTIKSMKNEWMIHNLSYYLNYKIDHSKDVDLNNNDEDKYAKVLFKRN